MPHTLHLVGSEIPRSEMLRASACLRGALQRLGHRWTLKDCSDALRDAPLPLTIGEHEDLEVIRDALVMLESGDYLSGGINLTDETLGEVARIHREEAAEAAGDTPLRLVPDPEPPAVSEAGWRTAIALMAHTQGNPLHAFGQARTYAHSTGQPGVYAEAQQALRESFPSWFSELLDNPEDME